MSDSTNGSTPLVVISEKQVLDVLEAWNKGSLAKTAFARSLHIRQNLTRFNQDAAAALREQINDSLQRLSEEQRRAVTQLFQKGIVVHKVAQAMQISESTVYRNRNTAIRSLAQEWTRIEEAAYRRYRSQIEERAQADIGHLFGVTHNLKLLRDALLAPSEPWVVGIDGIGGIGKTSLALAAILDHDILVRFDHILWVSARQSEWHSIRGIVDNARPALTYETLVSRILEQLLGPQAAASIAPREQAEQVRFLLHEKPILLVVDNLETAADQQALLPNLVTLACPTKILLTSRHSLRETGAVYTFSLDELPPSDALDLLRYELQNRNLPAAAAPDAELAQTYEVTGGNPLATKLVAGQLSTFPLERVLADLRQARGEKTDNLYRFIYRQAWEQLNEDARNVLTLMPLIAEEGGGLPQIEAVSQLPVARVTDALQQLVRFSLVNVRIASGPRAGNRYNIHRLTESFLLEEVVAWQKDP